MHAMFGSCTTGTPYEAYIGRQSRSTTERTITPNSSHTDPTTRSQSQHTIDHTDSSSGDDDESGIGRHTARTRNLSSSPPLPPTTTTKPKLFQNSRDRAEEAVMLLREQQLQQERDVSRRQKEYERIIASRALPGRASSQSNAASSNMAAASASPARSNSVNNNNNTTKKEIHSFFPASKPTTGRDPPGTHHANSPPRLTGIPTFATTYPSTPADTREDDLFHFDDDGVSAITQVTVDEMMRDLEQQQKDFANAFLMNRVYSDVTDPVERSFGHWKDGNLFSSMEGDPRTITQLPDPTESEFSPPTLTRQTRSSGTRSFFTKNTTHSNQTDEFDAWKMEEQQYWDSLVAKGRIDDDVYRLQ